MIDRRVLYHLDLVLIFTMLVLSLVGFLIIYSICSGPDAGFKASYPWRQIVWFVLGLAVFCFCTLVSTKFLSRYAYLAYGITLVLLLAVALLGKTALGAQRWISLGPFKLQPSEFAKVTLLLALARYFEDNRDNLSSNWKFFLPPLALIMVPVLLILRQPDLGTAILFLSVGAIIFFLLGLDKRWFVAALGGGMALTPLLWTFLKGYQKRRIINFLNPEVDPLGAGYHVLQSKIAIGSGGLWGKGLAAGTQTQLKFLPEGHTDFIFSTLAEITGFWGGTLVLIILALFIFRGLKIAQGAQDIHAHVLSYGVVTLFSLQIIINLGMALGMLPVVGVPLPFMSYGGSSMLASMAALGLLQNVGTRRYMY